MIMKLLALVMLATTVPAPWASGNAAPLFDNNPIRVSISLDATEDGYTVAISSSREGFTVDRGKLHVDRTALDGTVLARDAGVVTGAPATHFGPPGVAQPLRRPNGVGLRTADAPLCRRRQRRRIGRCATAYRAAHRAHRTRSRCGGAACR